MFDNGFRVKRVLDKDYGRVLDKVFCLLKVLKRRYQIIKGSLFSLLNPEKSFK